jgi:lon-related putative ATP-dependent protease
MVNVKPLQPEQLFRQCDTKQFSFETTDDLPDLAEIIGQARATEAIHFGIGIQHEGYNIFALGPSGAGKRSLVTRFFEETAKSEPTPSDWCYIHNFEHDYMPHALALPAGKGSVFQRDMEQLIEEVRNSLTSAFDSDEYRARRQVVEEELQEKQEKSLEEIRNQAKAQGLTLIRTPSGLVFAPVKDGEVLPPEEFQKLPNEERERLEKNVENLQEELQSVLQKVPVWQRELRDRIRQLNREITNFAVDGLMEELRGKYEEYPEVVDYLSNIKKDVVENTSNFLPSEETSEDESNPLAALMARARQASSPMNRYQVNLLVDHRSSQGAPVVYENNPAYQNLVGRVDHVAQMGALTTDFTMIKPGALHKANGGYLILDARKLLQQPYSWEALKRALESHQVRIESLGQMLSLISTVSLEPEPIPLDVKVALLGDRTLYYMLSELDPDFDELFKVQVDFEDQMDRTKENQELYAQLIATLIRKDGLRAFDQGAVARVIEHSARLVSDSEKMSTQIRDISSLLREANYFADQDGNHPVTSLDVNRAIDAQIRRADRVKQRMRETILRDIIFIDTDGTKVGQVNGLSVIQLSNFAFGTPSRITARIRLGEGEVIDIEREVELSGPIHSKGVLILAGFLGARYASDRPLSLSASLVFEQSYSGVEGDSASSAELYALISAISEVPIKQSLAVTGSVNQHGEVQPIGGVNEKIEGYFDICVQRGLTGEQGVLIPQSNIKNLMLHQDVVDAVRSGKFHIYPIDTIDQGLEVLTGIPSGEADEEGNYPPETINGKVQARLATLAKKRQEFSETAKGKEK